MRNEMQIGSFTFSIDTDAIPPVCLSVTHDGHWDDGIVAGGYCACMMGRIFWGYGHVASPELLYLYGVDHVISVCMIETGKIDLIVEFLVQKNGFTRYYFDHFPKWMAANGKNSRGETPEAFNEIKNCASLVMLSQLTFSRVTPKEDFMPEADRLARIAAKIANRAGSIRQRGISNMGETTAALLKIADAKL